MNQSHLPLPHRLLLAVAALCVTVAFSGAIAEPTNTKWQERLKREDRAALDAAIDQPAPAFGKGVAFVGAPAVTWAELRGKVVVLQSWTSASTAGRGWPTRLANSMKQFSRDDVTLIAVHTPEAADKANEFLNRQKAPESVLVAIDTTGEFCDGLGIYKQPVNVVVDRSGKVRYAGLTVEGLKDAVKELIAEPFDPAATPAVPAGTSSPEKPAAPVADFPPVTGAVGSAKDVRGQPAPEFFVSEWVTGQPHTAGKVVIIDFWATWCGPCVASIPHMNQLATEFSDDAVVIGVSDEKRQDFQAGLAKRKLNANSFKYALALDPTGQMSKAIQIRGIPHAIVLSKDGIVRWQGHPAGLNSQTLSQIVKANAALPGSSGPSSKRCRWCP